MKRNNNIAGFFLYTDCSMHMLDMKLNSYYWLKLYWSGTGTILVFWQSQMQILSSILYMYPSISKQMSCFLCYCAEHQYCYTCILLLLYVHEELRKKGYTRKNKQKIKKPKSACLIFIYSIVFQVHFVFITKLS